MIQRNDAEFYERVVRRIGWIILALGLAGAIGAASWKGVLERVRIPDRRGHLLRQLSRLASRRGCAWDPIPRSRIRRFSSSRLVAVLAGAWVIIKFLGLNLAAAALGLLVSGAAVILEIIYELIYAS